MLANTSSVKMGKEGLGRRCKRSEGHAKLATLAKLYLSIGGKEPSDGNHNYWWRDIV